MLRLLHFAVLLLLACAATTVVRADDAVWPEPTAENRPWTRWWWLGSAVEKDEISRLLREYHEAGIGGVEITCIYGVRGEDDAELPYRSDAWVEAVRHAIAEAEKLGMGVDLPPGSGWRMGGPEMTPELGNSRLVLADQSVAAGEDVEIAFDKQTPQAAYAVTGDGERVDLTDRIQNGRLTWRADDDATVYTAGYRWAGDRVKRPAPGGEGVNINPFWDKSVEAFLTEFSKTIEQLPGLRASFHDSFEYEGDWQPGFFDEFHRRRGYRLEERLPELSGEGAPELVARVKCDYRETLSDLVRDGMLRPWVEWSHRHGLLARNQSHGSPSNWLDLYALCDIPETESFGRLSGKDTNPLVMKFASSAANTMGKRLTSSESATWLDEHFHVTLATLKQLLDRQMTAGINHALYHGTAYSPERAAWPGWLFYASSQLNPQNPLWRDLPAINTYMARCQSLLQAAQPDNDVLLYWPIHDFWTHPRGLRRDIRVHDSGAWLLGQPIGEAATLLDEQGYAFDYVSDCQLGDVMVTDQGAIRMPGGDYQAIVIPRAKHLPFATLQQLAAIAKAGGKVLLWGGLPESAPGMAGANPDARWDETIRSLTTVAKGDSLPTLLENAGVRREAWAVEPLRVLRKTIDDATLYFIVNSGEQAFDSTITPQCDFQHAVLLDPMTGQTGAIGVEANRAVRLQLQPGESVFLRCQRRSPDVDPWPRLAPAGSPVPLGGPIALDFLSGSPELPTSRELDEFKPWTDLSDPIADKFAGVGRYTLAFDAPAGVKHALLDLGNVHQSARVSLNGGEPVTLIGPTFQAVIGPLKPEGNELVIEVTSTAVNRIRDLDRRGVPWRIFKDINLVTINYRKFDASNWPVAPQGLGGPVTLTPLQNE